MSFVLTHSRRTVLKQRHDMHKTHLHQDPWPLRGRKRNLVHEMGNMPERKIRRYKTNYYIVAAKSFLDI